MGMSIKSSLKKIGREKYVSRSTPLCELIVTIYSIIVGHLRSAIFFLKIGYNANRVIGCKAFGKKYSTFCLISRPRHIDTAKEFGVTNIITRRWLHQVVK